MITQQLAQGSLADPIWIPLWVGLLIGVPSIITSISNALNLYSMAKLRKMTKDNHDNIQKLEKSTNGKIDKLLDAKDELRAVSNAAAHAAGKLEGINAPKD